MWLQRACHVQYLLWILMCAWYEISKPRCKLGTKHSWQVLRESTNFIAQAMTFLWHLHTVFEVRIPMCFKFLFNWLKMWGEFASQEKLSLCISAEVKMILAQSIHTSWAISGCTVSGVTSETSALCHVQYWSQDNSEACPYWSFILNWPPDSLSR